MQLKIVTSNRAYMINNSHHATPGISFYMIASHFAEQRFLVKFLDTNFANGVGAAVIDRINYFTFTVVNPANIAYNMSKKITLGIKPSQSGADLGAVKDVLVDS